MKVGTRIIYGIDSGEIVSILHRMEGDVLSRPNEELAYVDVPFDDFDPMTQRIVGMGDNGKPIIEMIPISETEDQRRIRELEDLLLLQIDEMEGGIL